jgi:DNA-directed RNA polymerase subunit M/transcription elongation factor TFIIS
MATINLSNLDLPLNFRGRSSKSIEALLNERFGYTSEQIEVLTNIKRGDDSILNMESSPDFVYEIFFLLEQAGYEETIEILKKVANDYNIKLDSHFILNTRFFDTEILEYQKEISRLRDKVDVNLADSVYSCPRCHGKNVFKQTSEKQRTADEATIFRLTCYSCGTQWKE